MQQSWVAGNGDTQLFDPQIRSPSQSESASQSPSSTSHKLDELQQLPVAYPLLRVQLVNPEHPSAILEAKSHPEDALAWLIKAKSSAGTKRI